MKPYRTLGPAAAAHNRWCRECRRHRARSRRAGAAAWRRDDGAGWAGGSSARNVVAATSIFHGQRGKSRSDVMLRFTPEGGRGRRAMDVSPHAKLDARAGLRERCAGGHLNFTPPTLPRCVSRCRLEGSGAHLVTRANGQSGIVFIHASLRGMKQKPYRVSEPRQ